MLTTAISAIKALDQVFSVISKGEDHELLENLKDNKKRGVIYSNGSITRLLSKFVIEPTVIVSSNLRTDEAIENAIKLNVDMFTAFYTQAFNVLSQVHDLNPSTSFDLLSSNYGTGDLGFSSEDYEDLTEMFHSNEPSFLTLSRESSLKDRQDHKDDQRTMIREIEVTMTMDGKDGEERKVVMNVVIKANIIFTPFGDIESMISVSDVNKTFSSRLDDYRSGKISLGDLVFAGDLVKEYKQKRRKDSKELIKKMEDRSRVSMSKLGTAGALGFGKYYQMIIVTAAEKASIERKISGKLEKIKYKEKLLEQVNSMSITTMDPDFERLSVFIKDMSGHSEYSYKSLKKSKSSDELSDILKNMLASRMI